MTAALKGRCGNCMEPFSAHRHRIAAAPICQRGGVYREATPEELDAGYAAAFPEGPKPIATFRLDSPEDVARAKAALSPEALTKFFGPGGGGMAAFQAAITASSGDHLDNQGGTHGQP